MSRIHVKFTKFDQTSDFVIYRVYSPDFADNELIGEIRIDVRTRCFQFTPMGSLYGKAVISPYVFNLPKAQQDEVIKRDFPEGAYGGWTSRIARMVSRLLEKGGFPDEFYGAT